MWGRLITVVPWTIIVKFHLFSVDSSKKSVTYPTKIQQIKGLKLTCNFIHLIKPSLNSIKLIPIIQKKEYFLIKIINLY
jgi:hypothetical protein